MDSRNFYLESMFEVKGEYEKFSHTLSWVFCCIPVVCQALKQYDHIYLYWDTDGEIVDLILDMRL